MGTTPYSTATSVTIELPVPPDAMSPTIRTSVGSAKYAPEKDALLWTIKSFPGNKVGLLQESSFTRIQDFWNIFVLILVKCRNSC